MVISDREKTIMKKSNVLLALLSGSMILVSLILMISHRGHSHKWESQKLNSDEREKNSNNDPKSGTKDHSAGLLVEPGSPRETDDYVLEKDPDTVSVRDENKERLLGQFGNPSKLGADSTVASSLGWPKNAWHLQDSPNQERALFYDGVKRKWQVGSIREQSIVELVAEPPSEHQAKRVKTWSWLDNERLIGEGYQWLTPSPVGYEDEGWVESKSLYMFDLKTNKLSHVTWPSPLSTEQKNFQIGAEGAGGQQWIPLLRYYSVVSVSERGLLRLVSFDTTQPEGGNQREEGWYRIKQP
jgi:hypothetical protein